VSRTVVLLLAFALLVAGCGSGHAAKPRLSVKAFRAEASRICAEARTHAGRLARLRKLRPPLQAEDLYARWLRAERDAVEAAKPPEETTTQPLFDARVPLAIAEGKIAGYARRLGVAACA